MTDGPRASSDLATEISAIIASGAGRRELGSGYQAAVQVFATSRGDVVVKSPHRGGALAPLPTASTVPATSYPTTSGGLGAPGYSP